MCHSSPVQAAQDSDRDFTYTVTAGQAQITVYTGAGGAVTIPSTLGGVPVTSIGENHPLATSNGWVLEPYGPFIGCTKLTSISIPQSVTSIGTDAFWGCTGLTSISIPQGVTSIGGSAFYGCIGLTSITFNSPTTTIYYGAYTIPVTTTIIGYSPSTAKDYATKYGNPFQVIGTTTPTLDGVTVARLFGMDRVGTAVAVANAGWTKADTAILAPSADANLVDALAAAPLAGKTAPILLTDNNTLTVATKDELVKLGVKNVYVVGAISQTVVDQINAMSGVVATVLKGADRIGTAAAISSKLTNPAGSFVVGYGALADALSIASYAAANNYSILVANPDGTLPVSETTYIGTNVYIIGGPTLVANIPGTTRLFGADRFVTNQAVLNALNYQYNHVYVANGTDAHLVDSLVASSLAAESGASIILTDTNEDGVAATFNDVQAKLGVNAVVTALGGNTVVPDAVVSQVRYTT